jgi:proteasome accessory factor A
MSDRLVGLETEYILRFRSREPSRRRVANAELFACLLTHLQSRIPVAAAIAGEQSWFLGNGGGLRFERLPFYYLLSAAGFVEGATPECRGPREALRYQRAQDVLLSKHAAAAGGAAGTCVLLKTSYDGHGHFFGSHENYEATIGTGFGLLIWRLGLALMLPLLFLLFVIADVAALLLVSCLSIPVTLCCRLLKRQPGRHYAAGVAWLVFLCRTPAQFIGAMFVQHTAFCRLRRQLLPFLIARTIICGPGMVCPNGRFILSPRAGGLRSLCGLTAAGGRSVFYFCQIIKAINDLMAGDWPSFARIFHRRQRLQLTIGDSNMAQFAEYLKIGTTLLVLDAVEAGELEEVPRLRRPLRALRAISADPDLQTTVPLADGTQASALEIQRFYLNACRRFVDRHAALNGEAQQVLDLWEKTLDTLADEPARLVGKLDWVTKRWLIESAGRDAGIEELRKLDLRYHELSRDGYYLRLEATGAAPTIVEPEEVQQAINSPPENSPATVRGRLIRQHAGSGVRASWSTVSIPFGPDPRVIRL